VLNTAKRVKNTSGQWHSVQKKSVYK